MGDRRTKLYNNLIGTGKVGEKEIGTVEQFRNAIKDEKSARKLYNNLKSKFSEKEIGTEDNFYKYLSSDFTQMSPKAETKPAEVGKPVTVQQQAVKPPTISQSEVDAVDRQERVSSYKSKDIPSAYERQQQRNAAQEELASQLELYPVRPVADLIFGNKERDEALKAYNEKIARLNEMDEAVKVFDEETKKALAQVPDYDTTTVEGIQKRYLQAYQYTPEGKQEYANLQQQIKDRSAELDNSIKNEIEGNAEYKQLVSDLKAGRISEADAQKKYQSIVATLPSYKKTEEELDEMQQQYAENALGYFNRYINEDIKPFNRNAAKKVLAEQKQMRDAGEFSGIAENLVNKTEKLVNAVENSGGVVGNVAQGIWDSMTDWNFWSMGAADAYRAKKINDLENKITAAANGQDVKLSDDEKKLVEAYTNYIYVQSLYNEDIPLSYKAGQTTGESLPFMATILLGGGLTSAATKGLSKALGKTITKKIASTASKFAGKNAFTRGLAAGIGYGDLTKGALANLGHLTGSYLKGAGYASTYALPRTIAGAQERMTGQAQIETTPEGRAVLTGFEGQENPAEAYFKAWLDNTIEFTSENVGAIIDKYIPEGAPTIFKWLGKSKAGRSVADFMKATQRGSIVAEYLEEEFGSLNRTITGLQSVKDFMDNEQRVETFVSLIPMQVMFGVAGGAGHIYDAVKINRFKNSLSPELKGLWDNLTAEMEQAGKQDFMRMIREVQANPYMSEPTKVEFIQNLMEERKKQFATQLSNSEVENSYTTGMGFGYEGTTDKSKLRSDLEAMEQELTASGIDINNITEDDVNNNPKVKEYQKKRAEFEGMLDGAQQSIDEQVEEVLNVAQSNVGQSGQVIEATTTAGDKVFIFNGEVTQQADGTYKADGAVTIRKEDGTTEMVDGKTLNIESVTDGATYVETAVNNTREQLEQAVVDEIDGRLPINVGDVYNIQTESGVVPVTILGVDQTGGIIVDMAGQQSVMQRGQIETAASEAKKPMTKQTEGGYMKRVSEQDGIVSADVYDNEGNVIDNVEMPSQQYYSYPDYAPQAQVQQAQVQAEQPQMQAEASPQPTQVQVEQPNVQAETESVQAETESVQAETQAEPQIPTDKDGNILYDQMETEDAVVNIYNEQGLTEEEADQFVDANIKQSEKDVKAIEDKAPKMGTNMNKYKADKAEWQKKLDDARRKAEFWKQAQAIRQQQKAQPTEEVQPQQELEAVAETPQVEQPTEQMPVAEVQTEEAPTETEGVGEVETAQQEQINKRKRSRGFVREKPEDNRIETVQERFDKERSKFKDSINNEYADVLRASNNIDEAIKIIQNKILQAENERNDWESRRYKPNTNIVEGQNGLSAADEYSTTIGSANERRRTSNISRLNRRIEELKSWIEILKERTGYSDTAQQEQIRLAESEVNTTPTDAQKEAGNYKKGHIRIDGYDITIEQPKGSVRSGVDENGNKWETKMNNTYGYIRGTESVDGDHIDVFLSDNPTEGNVYVVDQINQETGEWDEHKILYGFGSMEEAKAAYLSNYSEGWKIGPVTEVSKDEFKKWINLSKRKTKPFSEYVSVKPIAGESGETASLTEQNVSQGTTKTTEKTAENEGAPSGGESRVSEVGQKAAFEAVTDMLKSAGVEVEILTDEQMNALAEQAGARKMTVYHGSGALFDRFDHSFMGTGEGAQAYGWGSYVTEVEGIGKQYAKTVRNNNHITFKGRTFDEQYSLSDGTVVDTPILTAYSAIMEKGTVTKARDFIKRIKDYAETDVMREHWDRVLDVLSDAKKSDFKKEKIRILYTVEIPDNTGTNYLEWEKVYGEAETQEILDRINAANGTVYSIGDVEGRGSTNEVFKTTGKEIYEILSDFEESPKAASILLSKAGFTGISFPAQYTTGGRSDNARNYVIFNDQDLKITDHISFLKDKEGKIYGAAYNGKIYLNGSVLNTEAPIHEYTHIWDDVCRKNNPSLWQKGVELMKKTPLWEEVKNDANYSDLLTDDEIASEVHSRLSGKNGAEVLDRLISKMEAEGSAVTSESIKEQLKNWLNEFWSWIKDTFGKWAKKDLGKIGLEEFVNMPLRDLVSGTKVSETPQRQEGENVLDYADRVAKAEEEKAKKKARKKLDLYRFVGDVKDETRPTLSGVYYSKGTAVGSDGKVLLRVKTDYPKEQEGKIVRQNGEVVEGKYPNVDAVIPKKSNVSFPVDVNELKKQRDSILENIKKRWKEEKTKGSFNSYIDNVAVTVNIGGLKKGMMFKDFDRLVDAMDMTGVDSLDLSGDKLVYSSKDILILAVMNTKVPESSYGEVVLSGKAVNEEEIKRQARINVPLTDLEGIPQSKDGMFQVYAVESPSGEITYGVPNGLKVVSNMDASYDMFGDRIYRSLEDAIKAAEKDRELYFANLEYEAKRKAEEAKQAEAKANSPLGKYLASLTKLQAGRAEKSLGKQVRYNGKVMTRAEFIEAVSKEGYVAEEYIDGKSVKYGMMKDGKSYPINKTDFEFAKYSGFETKELEDKEDILLYDELRVRYSDVFYTENGLDDAIKRGERWLERGNPNTADGKKAKKELDDLKELKRLKEKFARKSESTSVAEEQKESEEETTDYGNENQVPEEKAQPKEKIEDVGEKIGGAKKDKIKDYSDKIKEIEKDKSDILSDIARLPLSKIYNFDYAALRSEGVSNEVISLIETMKKFIPSKPRTEYKLKRWVNNVFSLYSMALRLVAEDGNTQQDWVNRALEIEGLKRKYDAYMALGGFDANVNTADAELRQLDKTAGYYGENGEWISSEGKWYVSRAGKYSGIFDTYEQAKEALQNFAGVNAGESKSGKPMNFSIYMSRKDGTYFITPKSNPNIIIEAFKSVDEARKYLSENYNELVDKYKTIRESAKIGFKENAPRQGRDWRNGKDISAEEFRETFGFRGVEFGNWANQQERQIALNNAYDAFMDLATATGKSPKAMSLNGELAMAFGARGGGKAMAHYEPSKIVINLTKTQGAGSLAHEWFHAIDNYFARQRGYKGGFNTEQTGYKFEYRGDVSSRKPYRVSEKERQELTESFDDLVKAINRSDYGKRSGAYSQLVQSKYWREPTELGARAFAKWVEIKLSQMDTRNDFLANNPTGWESLDQTEKYYPYPFESDMTEIGEAFDNLFNTIQEKVDAEGNVMLFRTREGGNYSREHLLNPKTKITMDNVAYALYYLSGEYMSRATGGKARSSNFMPLFGFVNGRYSVDIESARENYDDALEIADDYKDALIEMQQRSTEPAQKEIQNMIDRIDENLGYMKLYAEGKTTDESGRDLRDLMRPYFRIDENGELQTEGTRTTQIASEATALADKLNTPIRIANSLDELSESEIAAVEGQHAQGRRVAGFFNPATGEVVVYMPDVKDIEDVKATVFHEIVGHKGLRELYGTEFTDFLLDVYSNADTEVRGEIARRIAANGWDAALATEEYLAELAERGFDMNLWDKIADLFRKFLRKIGLNVNVSVRELRYILRQSYNNRVNSGVFRDAQRTADEYNMRTGRFSDMTAEEQDIIDHAKADGTYMLAPNGQPTNLTEKQWAQVRTQAFKDWFGDWENDAENASKVVDENGEPRVVQHGTSVEDLTVFDISHIGENTGDMGVYGAGFYFGNLDEYGFSMYGDNVIPAYLDIKNPYNIDADAEILDFIESLDFAAMRSIPFKGQAKETSTIGDLIDHVKQVREANNRGEYSELIKEMSSIFGKAAEEEVVMRKISLRFAFPLSVNTFINDCIGGMNFSNALKNNGNDGVLVLSNGNYSEFVAFYPSQIKSATDNIGTFSAGNEDIRYRTEEDIRFRSVPTTPQESAQNIYEQSVMKGFGNQFKEGWVDSMRAVKKAQDAIAQETGEPIKDSENYYYQQDVAKGKNRVEIEEYQRNIKEPLLNAVAVIGKKGKSLRDIEGYLNSVHGLERNEKMYNDALEEWKQKEKDNYERVVELANEKGEEIPEEPTYIPDDKQMKGLRRDYSGLTAIFGVKDVEKAEEEARKYIAEFESSVGNEAVNELWKRVKAANDFALAKEYKSGFLSKELYDEISGMYNNYVPLRGFDETIASDIYDYVNNNNYVFDRVVRKAEGRFSRAADIISHILNMGQSAIVRGNNNVAKQALLNLAIGKPTSLLTVGKVWYVKNDEGKFVEAEIPDVTGMTPEEARQELEDFESDMSAKARRKEAFLKKPKMKIGLRRTKAEEQQHIIRVYRNGREMLIHVNGNPALAQAVNGENRKGYHNIELINYIQRWRAALLTSYALEFMQNNFLRDIVDSSMTVFIKEGHEYLAKFIGNMFSIMPILRRFIPDKRMTVTDTGKRVSIRQLYNKFRKGKLDLNNKTERYFDEFMRNGGEIGFTQALSVEKFNKIVNKRMKQYKGPAKVARFVGIGVTGLLELIENVNRKVENICRFAAYMTSRESGKTILQSAVDSKEVSVNFNRSGSGAMGNSFAKMSYLFINPAIQSLVKYTGLARMYPKRFATAMGFTFSLGVLIPFLNSLLSSADGDDDDYYNLNVFTRRNNLNIYLGDGMYFSYSLPHEVKVIYGLGEITAGLINGKDLYENKTAAVITQLSYLFPIDFINANGIVRYDESLIEGILRGVTFDWVKPFFEAYDWNENFMGIPITSQTEYNKAQPEWRRVPDYKAGILTEAHKGFTELTSGSVYRRSAWDSKALNPAAVEHVLSSYIGGPWSFISSVASSVQSIWNEDLRTPSTYPFVRRVLKSTNVDYNSSRHIKEQYYLLKSKRDLINAELNGLRNETDSFYVADRISEMVENKEIAEAQVIDEAEKYIKEINKALKVIPDSEDEKRKELLRKKDTIMLKAVNFINDSIYSEKQ